MCFNETQKGKTNESIIISLGRAFHPINNWISSFTRIGNKIGRRHLDYNCFFLQNPVQCTCITIHQSIR